MPVTTSDCLAAIDHHTRGLAAEAAGNLDARIEHCPDWSMADLVWHVIGVHRFWNAVATDRPTEEPTEPAGVDERPRPADEDLTRTLVAGMEALVTTLGAADQQAPCWTWGLEQNVWFITRHQVQEAAIHHWDAARAVGRAASWQMDPEMASDAVAEFLTHSVANSRWPVPSAEPIGTTLALGHWDVSDGELPGTVRAVARHDRDTAVAPADLLLWLYARQGDPGFELVTSAERAALDRLKALVFTD